MKQILIIGSAMSEVVTDDVRRGLEYVREVRTAPKYRLFALGEQFAVLARDDERGVHITGEVVQLDEARYEEIVALEPSGTAFEAVELEGGETFPGIIGELEWLQENALEITEYGSYVRYVARADGEG